MKHRLAAITWALATGFAATNLSAQAAVFGDGDTTRLASISAAIQGLEDDVGAALHNLPADENGDIESYAYVELNLQAAHERLNNVFMLVAVSTHGFAIRRTSHSRRALPAEFAAEQELSQ
jgi:hypothetical protein